MKINVPDVAARSWAVTSVYAGRGNGLALQSWCETQAGLTLGIGLGREPSDAYYRIGHMGHVNAHMIMGVLGTIEGGLTALNIAHGRGALQAAADVLAQCAPVQSGDQLVQSQGSQNKPTTRGPVLLIPKTP